ncbi:MAG TPA: MFS transporter [Bacteroidales bacterium]|nr:MFS transporter [Bacteroidales bacterium]HPT02927.1 MFS transporter [Bacteroidales bacterium]
MSVIGLIPKDIRAIKGVFSSLRSRNYRIYFIGQGVSLIGTWMQNIALSWLVYRLTGSVFLLGLIGFTSQIPTFILSPFTGVVTDRHNRLNIMKLTQLFFMLHALTMTLLVMFNLVQVWHIITLSVIFGIITAFDAPARQSLVIDLIDDPGNLGNAIALNSAIFNAARLVGPAIAGIVIAIAGEGICFLFNTLSFAAVIFALMQIKISFRKVVGEPVNFKESFREGFDYTFRTMPIRTLIIMLALLSVVGLSYIVLLPAYAKENMHGSSDTLGYLMSAMGAGALSGALYMAARKSVLGLAKVISTSVMVMGAAISLASFSGNMFLSVVALFFGGLTMVLSLSSINTMLQTLADEDKRGRVMSFYAMALMGTTPIGNLLAGSIASGIGISWTLLMSGVITVISGIWFRMKRKSLRKHVRPIYVTKGILPGLPNDLT